MLKSKILLLVLLLSCVTLRAYDFSDTLPSGQVLYYSLVTGGVEVVHPAAEDWIGWSGYVKPTGALTIPSAVSHGGTAYAVVAVADFAFYNCLGLTSVTLSEGVSSVGISAFRGCSAVTDLTLPASLTTVDDAAFGLLSALSEVWMQRSTPPVTSATAFYSVDLSGCTLHVPCGEAAAYAAASPWSSFGTVLEGACSVHLSTAVNDPARGSVTGAGTYVPGTAVTITALPAPGYSFICWNDGDTLNPRLLLVTSDAHFTAMFFPLDGTVVVRDTVRDTLMPTFYPLTVQSDHPQLGVGVGNAVLPAGTLAEVCGLPLEGGHFVGWNDGVADNPRRVTVTEALTLTALFEQLSARPTEVPQWTVAAAGRRLTVCCGVGERLRIYDAQGRCHLSQTTGGERTTLLLPSPGVWLVQVGDGAARRVIID